MTRYRFEQALVSAFGLVVGLALAMLIAPGDIGLWVVIAILLAIFCRAFFIRGLYGELFWPVSHHRAKKADRPVTRHA
jgi:hypothetical protein